MNNTNFRRLVRNLRKKRHEKIAISRATVAGRVGTNGKSSLVRQQGNSNKGCDLVAAPEGLEFTVFPIALDR